MVFQLLKGLADCPDIVPSAIVLNEGRFAAEIQSIGIPIRFELAGGGPGVEEVGG